MTFLSPLALLWLGSVPVLIWLWRFAASRHQIRIPSLVPFEHLVRRQPTRRTRLVVNWLFWLQLAALTLLALTLAEPVLLGHRTKTVFVLVDTSASMQATLGGPAPFQRAKQYLQSRLAHHLPTEQLFLVTTAPVRILTPEPTSDESQLRQVVNALAPTEVAGNLAIANRIGRGLLGVRADETLVLTDEPMPKELDRTVTMRTFGQPLPNVAIVGIDAQEPLCAPTEQHQIPLVVTVQNVAQTPRAVTLSVRHNGQVAAEAAQRLEPNSRLPISLTVPEASAGLFEITLRAEHDALSIDNRAFISLRGSEVIHAVVSSDDPQFVDTIGGWLDACPRVVWRQEPPALGGVPPPDLVITNHVASETLWPSSVIAFAPASQEPHLLLTHWLADATHPISEYLEPLESVAALVNPLPEASQAGEPILWGVVEGRKVPIVSAASRNGRRTVTIFFDPTPTPTSSPVVLVFLNSLRWLTASGGFTTTGEPVLVGPFDPGVVRIQRPNGTTELQTHGGGLLRYDATDQAGRYRFLQGQTTIERVVNFLNPAESNTMQRASTWGTEPALTAAPLPETVPRHSFANWLLSLVVLIVLLEWIVYSRRGRR